MVQGNRSHFSSEQRRKLRALLRRAEERLSELRPEHYRERETYRIVCNIWATNVVRLRAQLASLEQKGRRDKDARRFD